MRPFDPKKDALKRLNEELQQSYEMDEDVKEEPQTSTHFESNQPSSPIDTETITSSDDTILEKMNSILVADEGIKDKKVVKVPARFTAEEIIEEVKSLNYFYLIFYFSTRKSFAFLMEILIRLAALILAVRPRA